MHHVWISTILTCSALSAVAKAGTCGDAPCWQFVQTAAGDAQSPQDILKVLQANRRSAAVQETLERVGIYQAAGITPAVTVTASHWALGAYTWTGPTTCTAGDPRLKTAPAFSHSYCLSNKVCVPGGAAPPPADQDPCG